MGKGVCTDLMNSLRRLRLWLRLRIVAKISQSSSNQCFALQNAWELHLRKDQLLNSFANIISNTSQKDWFAPRAYSSFFLGGVSSSIVLDAREQEHEEYKYGNGQ